MSATVTGDALEAKAPGHEEERGIGHEIDPEIDHEAAHETDPESATESLAEALDGQSLQTTPTLLKFTSLE